HARRAMRMRRALVIIAIGVVMAFGVFMYRGLQNSVAQRLAEAKVTQSYAEQGRHALVDGKHTEALIYLEAAARRGDGRARATFMLAHAAQPFLANRARLTASSGRVWSATFSRDGQRIVTSDDKSARLWDAQTNRLIATLSHDDTVYDASFSPDSMRVVTA